MCVFSSGSQGPGKGLVGSQFRSVQGLYLVYIAGNDGAPGRSFAKNVFSILMNKKKTEKV